jgi:hypothetical protein
MPTIGFEVRGRIVRRRSPTFAGLLSRLLSKRLDGRLHLDEG